jgi:hypothetical protein
MPPLPDKRSDMDEEKYSIQVQGSTYVLTKRWSDSSTLFYIGGKYNYCLECQLFTDKSFMARITDITLGDLPHVYYEEECRLDAPFLRGIDTRRILYLMISYIQNTCPTIRGLIFTDKSYRDCDDGQTVDLAILYYLVYKKTWYMAVLGAEFVNEQDKAKFQKAEIAFDAIKKEMSWEGFKDFITVKLPIPEDDMKVMYDTAETWQGFFLKLRDAITASKFCIFISPWVKTFWNKVFRFNFESVKFKFLFSAPELQTRLEYTLTKYNQKGGKYTRKNRRIRKRGTHKNLMD